MTLSDAIDEFVRLQMRQGKRYVPARLQAAMALMRCKGQQQFCPFLF